MKLNYVQNGDYLFPEITVSEPQRFIGKYGILYRDYLKENHPGQYSRLILSGSYTETLCMMNEQVQTRMDVIIRQMAKEEQVTEQLKAEDQILWIQKMNNIRNRAEEIVLNEMIYSQEEICI